MTRILGQQRAIEILNKALRSGRFHHAWIFSGPRGVGKFTTAVEVARVLLDPDIESAHQFPVHNSASKVQRLIDSGTHPDLHIIRKELAAYSDMRELRDRKQTNIPINLLRERVIGGKSGETYFEAPAYRTAQLGHGKVFVIDEAELLDDNGQNAMLKTLEEPPAETYFFLITTQPDRLLPTIHSRCQHVQFGRLDDASMRTLLAEIAPATAKNAWIVEYAEGSPGAALLAAEFGFDEWRRTLDPMLADLEQGKFPAAMGEMLGKLVEEFAAAWVKKHGDKTSKDAANKDGARHIFTLLSSHGRQKLAARIARAEHATDWMEVIDLLGEAERQLDSNVNQKLVMENLVVQWAQASTPQVTAAV